LLRGVVEVARQITIAAAQAVAVLVDSELVLD
jgi:hypothetical protein